MSNRSTLLFVVLGLCLGIAYSEDLPDCDDLWGKASKHVKLVHENCREECPNDLKCFNGCVVDVVKNKDEDGDYLKGIVEVVSSKHSEGWKQDIADQLSVKCIPLAIEQKMEEAFECWMETINGKCNPDKQRAKREIPKSSLKTLGKTQGR